MPDITHGASVLDAADPPAEKVAQFKTVEQQVEALRNEMRPHLAEAAKIMDKFAKLNLVVGFNIQKNQAGQHQVHEIIVSRFY